MKPTDPEMEPPSVVHILTGDPRIGEMTIKRPELNLELFPLLEVDSSKSPAPQQMSLRRLRLGRMATPCHRHKTKEKIYTWLSGSADVYILGEDGWEIFTLSSTNCHLAIPAGFWHAIVSKAGVELTVYASSQDGKDVQWENI